MELTKQKSYQQAFDVACASLRGMNIEERATKAGAEYLKSEKGEAILLSLFSEPYHMVFPQMEFRGSASSVVSLAVRTLLLHYLLQADGSPLAERWVAYQDIPGGLLYAGVFGKRVTEPLAKAFGRSHRSFMEAGLQLGGKPVHVGDASFILRALPRVPLQFVLWEGDDEFPPKVHLLFDASVDHYLSLEDIVVLGQMAARRIIHRTTIQSVSTSSSAT
jgi:hypothetical protein